MGGISKKRCADIKDVLLQALGNNEEATAHVLQQICNILHFDPNAPTYTPEQGQRAKQNRHRRAAERGVTTYITSGAKSSYEKRKREKTNVVEVTAS